MNVPENVDDLPTTGVADFIKQLAKAHQIKYQRSAVVEWAEAVTRNSGDDVTTDGISGLLIRLKQRNILNNAQFIRLIVNYRRERISASQ